MKKSPLSYKITSLPSALKKLNFLGRMFIILILGFSSFKINAQSINWIWFTDTGWDPMHLSSAESLVIDPSGNFYSTGTIFEYLPQQYQGDAIGAFVGKFNGAGGSIWYKIMGGAFTQGTSISIDDEGNVYTTGTFEGTEDFDPGSGTFTLTSAGSSDIFISKLNSSGDFVWAKSIGGPLADGNFRSCLTINPDNGDLYLTGYFNGTADFDPGSGNYSLSSTGGDDIFITSLDTSGNFLWAGRMGGGGSDVGKSIARDNDGNIVSTGKYTGTCDFNPGTGYYNLTNGGTYISKLSGDGAFTFAKKIGSNTGNGNAIAVDASNNIYTTGPFTGTNADFDPGPGQFVLDADGTDFFISKLDESGNFVWAVKMTGEGYAEAYSLAVDNGGNVFTTGQLGFAADLDPGTGQFWIQGDDTQEMFVSKLDASGNFVFAEVAGGDDCEFPDIGNGIAVDNAGNGIIAGQYEWYFNIGPFAAWDFLCHGTWTFFAKFGTEVVPPLSGSITGNNILCSGESTGSATTQFSGGFSPYDYDWSNGQTGAEINNLAAGTYTVTVTDNYDNSATAQVVITEPPLLEFSTPIISNVSCNNGNDGSIQVNGTGGVSPYIFEWSNGESGPSISNLEAGTYTVTITDSNDCTQTESYQVEQPNQLEISLVNINNETCAGSNDGGITIDISGGTNPVNAVWSNGNTGTSNMNLTAGAHSVTITDNNDCTQTAEYTIQPGTFLEITLVLIHQVSCAGGTDGSVSVTGFSGVPPYAYLWSNGETGSSIDTLAPGLYGVTMTDSYGCFNTAEYMVNEPSAIIAQISQPLQILCAGDSTASLSAMASGGTSPLSALWSNGITGFENPNLGAGIYSVTITDAHACISILSDTISEPTHLNANAIGTNETGSGANDGTAMSSPTGGIPPFNILWNTGDTLSALSGLSPGTYTVTITDANGCMAEGTALVNAFGCTLDIVPGADLNICEEDTIVIQPVVMGGSAITYLWSDGSIGEILSVYQTGEYCVTVSDETGCQDLDCVFVNEIILPPFSCPATDESTPGANDGSVQCDSLSDIISYLWSNGATTSNIDSLSPGQYCVTVTEENGCTATQCFYVQPGNCQMAVNDLHVFDLLCAGDSSGAIILTIENGTDPITYNWSNGGNSNENANLPSGNYMVTISDANGCGVIRSYTIAEPPPLSVRVDSIAHITPSSHGLIWISVEGGIPPYNYQWVDSLGVEYPTEDINDLTTPGYYSLTLKDKHNCNLILDSVKVELIIAVDQSPVYYSIKVYPVPAKEELIIDTDNLITEVLISGVDGRDYKHILRPESNQLDISDLGPGWYMLRIRMGNTWYVARVVK